MQNVKTELASAIKTLYGLDFEPDLTPSPENIAADYSSNAPLKLAKTLHKSPIQIAEEISKCMAQTGDMPEEDSSLRHDAAGKERTQQILPQIKISQPGFLNFTLSDEDLNNSINDFSVNLSSERFRGQTVICEFSDPNPFKVLHVGHLYTSVVGDSIARLFEYAGAKVVRANFGGDVGLHVAKTLYVLRQKPSDNLTIEDIAKCYVKGTALYDDDEAAHQEITQLNKEIYKINAENLHDTDLAKLYWQGRELSYDYFKGFYDSIGVKFDKYYPESTVANLGLEKVKQQLTRGVYEYSDGAVIFNGEKFGLHTRVFINQEGVPTYETKDVGLIFTKWQDYHFDKSIVITGSEQLDYMKVVLKSVEQYAPELVERTTHLTHGLVKLPGNVKMSSRKGNFLKAVDVIDMVKTALHEEYDSDDPIVSLAATKYAFLKYKMGGNIIFDPKESVKMTGNSGPYLLYSCVRAKKILQKSADKTTPSVDNTTQEGGSKATLIPAERNLIKKILEYAMTLDEAVSEMAPHKVANYLYELAQSFSRFYEKCPVNGSDREHERLRLVTAYLGVMSHGLNILGIEIPEEM